MEKNKETIDLIFKKGVMYKHDLMEGKVYTEDWETCLVADVPTLDYNIFGEYQISSGYHPKWSDEEIWMDVTQGCLD